MPSKKSVSGQGGIKSFRSDVAKLKSLGLVSKRVDARSQRDTRYMKSQVRKFSDVLAGKAKVVHTPTRAQAKEFADTLRVKGKSVVVPVNTKTERVRFNPKAGTITSSGTENGMRVKKLLRTKQLDLYDIKTYPRGANYKYRMPFANGARFAFDTPEDLFAFMFQYESKVKNPFRDWQKYVEILQVSNPSDIGDDDADE